MYYILYLINCLIIVCCDVLIFAGGYKSVCITTGHLQFMVKVSMISHFLDWILLVVMGCVLSSVSTLVSDPAKHSSLKEGGSTPAKGRTPSFLKPKIHSM